MYERGEGFDDSFRGVLWSVTCVTTKNEEAFNLRKRFFRFLFFGVPLFFLLAVFFFFLGASPLSLPVCLPCPRLFLLVT